MSPSRRDFLRLLSASMPVAAAPTYFFAPIGGWKSEVIENPSTPTYWFTASDGSLHEFSASTLLTTRVSSNMYSNQSVLDRLISNYLA